MISKKIFCCTCSTEVKTNKELADNKILDIKELSIYFKNKQGLVRAVRGVDFSIKKGQIIGLVGESGSGKSVTVKFIIGFNSNYLSESKKAQYLDINLKKVKKNQWTYIRGTQISYIPQDPLMSLNPLKQIRYQLFEAYLVSKKRQMNWDIFNAKNKCFECANEKIAKIKDKYKKDVLRKAMYKKVIDILEYIGIKDVEHNWKLYPHEFSGGMRQRIVIAMSVLAEPKLIIADEPTTALDVTVQAMVIDLIKKMAKKFNIAVIFISHNIGLVANLCEYIYVMYAGKIVEKGKTWEIFSNPRHPYTWALISSIPDIESDNDSLVSIPGSPPNMLMPPRGDAFAARNKYALEIDFEKQPPMFEITKSHKAATWLLHPDSPDIPIPEDVVKKLQSAAYSTLMKKGQTDGK